MIGAGLLRQRRPIPLTLLGCPLHPNRSDRNSEPAFVKGKRGRCEDGSPGRHGCPRSARPRRPREPRPQHPPLAAASRLHDGVWPTCSTHFCAAPADFCGARRLVSRIAAVCAHRCALGHEIWRADVGPFHSLASSCKHGGTLSWKSVAWGPRGSKWQDMAWEYGASVCRGLGSRERAPLAWGARVDGVNNPTFYHAGDGRA